MDPALLEKLRDIPQEEIDRTVQQGGYSRWAYFTDAEGAEAGVICAGDDSLAAYYPVAGNTLQPGPLGVMKLRSLRYVPSAHQLYIVSDGHFLTLQVFSDIGQAGDDTATPREWQQFLAEHSVRKMSGSTAAGRSYKLPAIAAGAALAAATLIIVLK